MHTQGHTHKSTHVQSAHKRNGDNQAQEPGWEGQKTGAFSETKVLFTHKKEERKCQNKPDVHESKEKDTST